MSQKDDAVKQIHEAFCANQYPGDSFLQGSFEGCEPYDEVGYFKGKKDWKTLDAEMLDAHYDALSFFSETGFRFFLPAFLIADLEEELRTADPLFHLTGGFLKRSVEVQTQAGVLNRKYGGETLLNPRRYGAISFADYARFRLSVFTKEEAVAIVAYLYCIRGKNLPYDYYSQIDTSLNSFWLDRAQNAPSREDLIKHIQEEEKFIAGTDTSSTPGT
jgi:hypothetical protein